MVFALFLAIGALTYALDANPDNALVAFVRDAADAVDLGVFSLENGIKEFVGDELRHQERPVQLGPGRGLLADRRAAAGPHRASLSASHPTARRHSVATYSLVTSPPHIERTGGAVPATPL